MSGACSTFGREVGKPEGNRPLGKSRRRWKVNIKMNLHDVGLGAWTGLF